MTRVPSGIGWASTNSGTVRADESSTNQVTPSSIRAMSVRGNRPVISSQ